MNGIPRNVTPEIQQAYRRLLDHAEDHLLNTEDSTLSFTQWEDGDFQLEVYSGFDCRRHDMHHGEHVRYKRFDGEFVYANFTREFGWHTDRGFREYVIEEWTPTSVSETEG